MPPEAPKRRFAAIPVETSSKTNRPSPRDESPVPQPKVRRKFAVEPVETTVRSNAHETRTDQNISVAESKPTASKPARRFAVEPVETSSKHGPRNATQSSSTERSSTQVRKTPRFAIEPVETSVRQVKGDHSKEARSSGPRKFAIQPVESSTSSNRKSADEPPAKPTRRFAPQPVEVPPQQRRRSARGAIRRDSELDETPADLQKGVVVKKPARKFAPQLIDVSTRTRKASDGNSPMPHKFKTDVTPGHLINAKGEAVFPTFRQNRRLVLPHERRKERTGSHSNVRSHSFLCPDLETIESSESEVSEAESPSHSTSPSTNGSPLTTSDGVPESYRMSRKSRSNVDEGYQYLLDLEAQRAEETLREQALAAYPNSDFHQPVAHYADNEENENEDLILDDRPATWEGHDDEDDVALPGSWRKDTTKVDWELQEMKRYREEQEKARAAALLQKKTETRPSPWWNAATRRDFESTGADTEWSQMRKGARPPMLGDGLVFPRSQSPEPARFDITQGSHALRSQMCYLTAQADARNGEPTSPAGLWGGPPSIHKFDDGKGLWGGLCSLSQSHSQSEVTAVLPSGLTTPAVFEVANPFDETLAPQVKGDTLRLPAPPHVRAKLQDHGVVVAKLDAMLNSEAELDALMEREYPDTFVTQVFNYLSLGYPTLARPFDEELSKITSTPVDQLRNDDTLARGMPKGYIRIGEDFEGRADGTSQELEHNKCARWRALKQYIREWAQQEKGMVKVASTPFATAPRKGSWAW